MDTASDFFTNVLVWVIYISYIFGGYIVAWVIALGGSRIPNRGGVQGAIALAWKTAFVLHLLAGLGIVCWICIREQLRGAEGWYVLFFMMILYMPIIVLDLVLLRKFGRRF